MDNVIQQIKSDLEKSIKDRKAVFLFTGDKGSTLLIAIVKDMDINIVFVDTGCQFDEVIDYVKGYGNKIEIIKNNNVSIDYTADMVECCSQRKATVLKEYLKNIKAECLIVPFMDEEKNNGIEDTYLTGIEGTEIIRPLAKLTERDIWVEIKENKLPFSKLYNKGYKLIDCRCCVSRHGRRKQSEVEKAKGLDKETEEKLKSLGYM